MSGARESSREATSVARDGSQASLLEPTTRLEIALVVECLVACALAAGSARRHDHASWSPLAWSIVLSVAALLVPRSLARSTWGAGVARHAMAVAFTALAVFTHAVSSGAFPLAPHLVVIALLMTGHRDPAVVAVVGLVAGTLAVAHDLGRREGPPMLALADAVWLGVAILLLAAHTAHLQALTHALSVERARPQGVSRPPSASDEPARVAADDTVTDRAATERTQWLAALSHELRTPLHAVVGFLELLARSPLSDDQSKHVEGANTSAQHVLALVADVLETARIESGALELEREPFDVGAVVREAVRLVEGTARGRSVSLELALGDDLARQQLVGDALRLRQILINLLGNGVKYARSRVTVRAEWVGETDALQIDVEDDGPGLAEGTLQRVFQPYRQADRGTARRHGGTGLGLAISRKLARLMRGDVVVRATSSRGTTFRFFAPLPRADAAVIEPERIERELPLVRPLRVLLADDDASNRFVTSELLRLLGHEVTLTEDGQQALEQGLRARHDLLLLDVEMPGLSGPEVARKVRMTGNRVPIVGLTGHGGFERRLTYLRAGMDAVIVKPADLARLRDTIAGVVSPTTSTSGAEAPDTSSADETSPARRAASQLVVRELGSGLDLEDLRHRVGGDAQLAGEVLVAVRDESRRLFTELAEAAGRGDLERLRIIAHTLKGCVANVGARPVREAVTAVENAAKSGEPQRATELASHAIVLGQSLSAALEHACGVAVSEIEREGKD
ncbi:MAG: response regulator [Deltaproteobacteria bacterium]|nr:response regulator [Deltaproteobacteria bacterium]